MRDAERDSPSASPRRGSMPLSLARAVGGGGPSARPSSLARRTRRSSPRIRDLPCMRGAWRFPRVQIAGRLSLVADAWGVGLGAACARGDAAGAGSGNVRFACMRRWLLALRPFRPCGVRQGAAGGFGAFTSLSGDVRVHGCRLICWYPVVVAKYLFWDGRKAWVGGYRLSCWGDYCCGFVDLRCPLCDSNRVDLALWDVYADALLCLPWWCAGFRLMDVVVC